MRLSIVQASAAVAGIAVGVAAYAGKAAIELFAKYRNAPPRLRQFYKVLHIPNLYMSSVPEVGFPARTQHSVAATMVIC